MRAEDAASRIIALMEERGWSTYRTAKETGIPSSTLYAITKGKRVPNNNSIDKLCSGFGITLGEFYADDAERVELLQSDIELVRICHKLDEVQKARVLAYAQGMLSQNEKK